MTSNTEQVEPTETWQTGTDPPSVPGLDAARTVVEAVGDVATDAEAVGIVRVRLASVAPSVVDGFLEDLDREPTVRSGDPGDDRRPTDFDMLVDPNHDARTVAAALAGGEDVVGAAVATYSGDALLDDADVTPRSRDEPDHRDARETFESLKAEVEPVDYETLLEELESQPFDDGAIPEVDGVSDDQDAGAEADDGIQPAEGARRAATTDGGSATEEAGATPESTDGDETTGVPRDPPDGREPAHSLDPDAVLEALVTALEADEFSDEQREVLRSAVGGGTQNSLEARVDHLQTRVDSVAAYTDALEAFLDEHGGGEQVIAEFETQVEELRAAVSVLARKVDDLRGRIDRHGDRLDRLEAAVSQTADLDRRLDGVADDVEELSAWRRRLTDAFSIESREE